MENNKNTVKQKVIQLLQDASCQDPTSDSYEQRIIRDNDFEDVAESIINMHTPPKYMSKEETYFQKERRLKARKQSYRMTYKKGVFHHYPEKLKEYLDTPDIVIRVHAGGQLDDGTEFIQITIEGIKPE